MKGNAEAHIALVSIPENVRIHTIEIGIGVDSNSRIVMRKEIGGTELAARSIPNLLRADRYEAFWVSWSNNNIHVGAGDIVNRNSLISHHRDFTLPVMGIAFDSAKGNHLHWLLKPDPIHLTAGTPSTKTFIFDKCFTNSYFYFNNL